MDQALVSTLSALAGTVIGGVTTFATSWLTQATQSRAARLAQERGKREELYARFMEETARLYSHAVSESNIDYANLVDIFALRGRILLASSSEVVQAADEVIRELVEIYIAPNWTVEDVRRMMTDKQHDPMIAFAKACRTELRAISLG